MTPFSAPLPPHIEPRRWDYLQDTFCAFSYEKYVRRGAVTQ